MSSEPMPDPRTDPLLTPANSALLVIDYQPNQIKTVTSMDTELLVRNIVSVARLGKAYGLPIVLSTVNAAAGQGPTSLRSRTSCLTTSRSTGLRSIPGRMSNSARPSTRRDARN
jgi:nicotinamidase-related amidase